jgi:carbon dioxide concentrating mechanism protein CcmN
MIGPLPTAITNPDAPALEGQVEVAEGVALGDGVVLDAAPGCRLVVAPGVCLGSGAIIQAVRGDVVVEPGAVLGSGVLIFGTGRIGQNACIGAESTVINPAIASGQVVPPNSLLGDPSQSSGDSTAPNPAAFEQESLIQGVSVQEVSIQEVFSQEVLAQESSVQDTRPELSPDNAADTPPQPLSNHAETEGKGVSDLGLETEQADSPNTANGTRPPAHGQKQVQDLLAKLFPHRQPLNGVTSGGVSPEDKP